MSALFENDAARGIFFYSDRSFGAPELNCGGG
jgi:hypothetical protein